MAYNPTFATSASPASTAYEQIGGNSPLGDLVGGASTSLVGFYATAPVTIQSAGVTATDTTSAITLVNQLRTSLIAVGLLA
jgi:hypothetical protein